MNNVKKVFEEVVELLELHREEIVKDIFPAILELVTAKSPLKVTYHHEGELVAIYCYYHKQWELLSEVEYGAKKSSKTGFNTMCKKGVSHWTKQQRVGKKANADLLTGVATGAIEPALLPVELARIEEEKKAIVLDVVGYDTEDELLEAV